MKRKILILSTVVTVALGVAPAANAEAWGVAAPTIEPTEFWGT